MTTPTAARNRIVGRFVQAGATVPERAIRFEAEDAEAARLLRRLRRHGAIAEAAPGRYWLDPVRLDRFRGALRRRTAAWAATSGIAATLAATAAAFTFAE